MKDFCRLECLFLILFSGYLLQLINGASLVINPTGNPLMQPLGKGFGLTCKGEEGDDNLFSEYKWIGPHGEIKPSNLDPEVTIQGRQRGGGSLLLMFKSPQTNDSGIYTCISVYSNLDKLNASVELIFFQDISWVDCPQKQALIINRNDMIRCRVSANPPAAITWKREGQYLEDTRYETKEEGVQVTGVNDDDAGEFSVTAMVQQTGKFQARIIEVEVHVPPVIEHVDGDTEAIEGSETRIRCQASGFPRPLYSWIDKDQKNLSNVDGYDVDSDSGTIIIKNVKREDDGLYTCIAKNPAGENSGTFNLVVIVKPEIKKFDNVTTVQGEEAKFECHAYGDPAPSMSMRKDGLNNPASIKSDERMVVQENKEDGKTILTVTILKTDRTDDGLYYCAAENKGAVVEKVGHLTVEFAPVIEQPGSPEKTWNGNPYNLSCVAESIPNATITWHYMGQEIRSNDIYVIHGNSARSNLEVRPPEQPRPDIPSVYGTYKCDAKNRHGTEYINIELHEAFRPSEVRDIHVEKLTATTITFSFKPPADLGGLPIRLYVIKYYEEPEEPMGEPVSETFEWSEDGPYILKSLKPRGVYKYQIAARNSAGLGTWSEVFKVILPSESFPEPPVFITPGVNISTYPDRFEIRWIVPLDNGKTIDYFSLRYFEVEKRGDLWNAVSNSEAKEEQITEWEYSPKFKITGLKANSHYKVELRAHNSIGYSVVAPMVFQTAAGGDNGGTSGYHGSSGLSAGAIAAIIIVLVLVILIVLDVTCYVRYEWGVLYVLRNRICAKSIVDNKAKEAAVEDGKGGKGDSVEKKSKTEVDNPAFDKEKELLKAKEEAEQENESEVATEDTPMIQCSGAKDTKPSDNTDEKNKSPKGSKSSIAKDSLV